MLGFVYCQKLMVHLFYPDTVPIRTVNRQCSSGLQAVADVAAFIKAGYYDIGERCSKLCIYNPSCVHQ